MRKRLPRNNDTGATRSERSSFSPGSGCGNRKAAQTGVSPNAGWHRWPEPLSNSKSLQRFHFPGCRWASSPPPNLPQEKHSYGSQCFFTRKLAICKLQVTDRKTNAVECFFHLPGIRPVRFLLRPPERTIIQKHPPTLTRSKPLEKLLAFLCFSSSFPGSF